MAEFSKAFRNLAWKVPGYIREAVVCADGFKMSVQASDTHYCEPREKRSSYYYKYEVGFPSEKEDLLMSYAEDEENPTKTVYGWVPEDVIEKIIEKHGGLKEAA